MKDLFEYQDYREYLTGWIANQPKRGRGMIAALAKAARCQSPYFSRVLLGKAQLSLEQAHALQRPLGHNRSETAYFILLVEWARAGDRELKTFFLEQLESARAKHVQIFKTVYSNRRNFPKNISRLITARTIMRPCMRVFRTPAPDT